MTLSVILNIFTILFVLTFLYISVLAWNLGMPLGELLTFIFNNGKLPGKLLVPNISPLQKFTELLDNRTAIGSARARVQPKPGPAGTFKSYYPPDIFHSDAYIDSAPFPY